MFSGKRSNTARSKEVKPFSKACCATVSSRNRPWALRCPGLYRPPDLLFFSCFFFGAMASLSSCFLAGAPGCGVRSLSSWRSRPAQKPRPAPLRITTRVS